MIKIKTETVVFDKAVPAPKLQVFLWLITSGRRGRLFEREKTDAIKYSSPPVGLDCRCVTVPIIHDPVFVSGEHVVKTIGVIGGEGVRVKP